MSKKEKYRNVIALGILILFIGMSVNPLSVALQDFKRVNEINGNSPPSTPIFLGPTEGFVGVAYSYTINSTDPEGDDVYYLVAWEFGVFYEWFGPYESGEEVTVTNTWYEEGTYLVIAGAMDVYNAESEYAILEVIIREVIYVDDDNTAGPWNGTMEYPYQYIQDGVDAADSIDTVFVYNGTYYENVVIDNDNINLIGEDRNNTIIDGGGNSDVIDIIGNGVTICNFKIQNSGVSFFIRGGIKIQSNQNSIDENIIKENDMGIYLPGGMNNTITSNIFLDNHNNGIRLSTSSNNRICNNTVSENGGGISILRGENNLVSDNNITENQHNGIYMTDSPQNCILNNTITDNGAGIQVYWKSFNNLFSGNIIINNSDFNGIAIGESSNNTVSKNIIINSLYGIYIYRNSSFNTITENEIENNHFGIYFKANASYNIIDVNSITNHEIGIIFMENCNNNSFTKNRIANNNFGVRLCFSSNKNIISENDFFNSVYDDIWIVDSSYNNHIYHNNFNDNTQNQNGYDLCINLWNDIYPSGGNYWCLYQGGDANGDGLGDTPYNISGGSNQDLYPLMNLWGENLPVASFTYSADNLSVTFDASSSYDRDGEIVEYAWDFGDGASMGGDNPIVGHTYSEPGTYVVTLTVFDDDGYEGQITKEIETSGPPEFKIDNNRIYFANMCFDVTNIGYTDAIDVVWVIDIDTIIDIPSIPPPWNGIIDELSIDETERISTYTYIFGLGIHNIIIKLNANGIDEVTFTGKGIFLGPIVIIPKPLSQ